MARERFFLIVRDDDKRAFSVEGPMTDDTDWTTAVVREQSKGRQVRCSVVPGARDLAQLKASYAKQETLINVPAGSILLPSIDLD